MSRYLIDLLSSQDLTSAEIQALQNLRNQIQGQLSTLSGYPRFYYAGSYGKKTMIKARYDLDIVVYWPHTTSYAIKEIYDAVGNVLKKYWTSVNSKTVCWELPFKNGFHIDVVPGRALDDKYYEANLYRTDTKTTLKTSLKKHIKTVETSERIPAIRLMKLWRERRRVPFQKSFLLELMTIEACKGIKTDDYHKQVMSSLKYIQDNIINCQLRDPANTNNFLADDLKMDCRRKIKAAASVALMAESWDQIFG